MANFFGKLRSGASKTAFEADRLMRVRRAEGELSQIRKQIDTLQERLGEITYLNYIHKEPQGQDSIDYIDQLTALEQQVTEKQEEIKNIQEESFEHSESKGAPSEANIIKCSNCNHVNPANTKFCSNCGSNLSN